MMPKAVSFEPSRKLIRSNHVRRASGATRGMSLSVAAAGAADPQAAQPGAVVQPLHVHGLLPAQLPAGEEAVHHLCLGLPRRPLPHLLQLLGKLLPLSLPGRHPATRSPRPGYRGHLEAHHRHHHAGYKTNFDGKT